ncbi:MAG TPA: MmgE/PrpD family protein [Syntrophorhabdaceae bacterium]|nr:MmgE/PrpD family protein [Syntrophorhabdaceae bacterium]
MAKLIDQLTDHILHTRYEELSNEVIDAGKKRIIDAISCTIGGANGSGNKALLDLIRGWGGRREATILAHGDKVPLPNAAMMNSIMTRSFDFEVTGPEPEGRNAGKMVGHVASTTEPAAVSISEYTGASGKEMIAAVVLGGDLAARLAVADDFNFVTSFEACGTVNAFGATAIAGRLMHLDHAQMVNAFGILVNLLAGSFQSIWDGVHSFKLPGAMSAYNGVLSVLLSQRGFQGIRDALSSPLGYFGQYCKNPHPENALVDLGTVYYVKGQHKLHPSCYGNHNALECALEILKKHEIDSADIESITFDVPPNRIKHFLNQYFEEKDCQVRALFSLPFGIANAFVRKEVRIEHYTDDYIRDPRVLALVKKITLVPNLPLGKNHAGRLTVKLKNGQELSAYREDPLGWLDAPTPFEEIKNKFMRNIEFSKTVSKQNGQKALSMFEHLEDVDKVSKIIRLLVPSKTR